MSYHIEVDREVCMSSGKCVADAAPAGDERVLDLARASPSGALVVRDSGTGQEVDIF